jgi:protein-disulfide isomerase
MITSGRQVLSSLKATLEWAGTVAILITAVGVAWVALDLKRTAATHGSAPPLPIPAQPVSLVGAALLGSTSAPGALIVFSDFQCPSCGHFARNTFEQIQRDYIKPGRILFAFRNFPLDVHPLARDAAAAAGCAGRQGRFWDMHDDLFRDQQHLDDASLRLRSDSIGLDRAQFDQCFAAADDDQVDADVAIGNRLMVQATPTFFVGELLQNRTVKVTERLQGDRKWKDYETALDKVAKR